MIWAGDAGFGRDVLEFPIAEVAIKGVVAFKAAEIDVHPAVAIDVAERHAGADFVETIFRHCLIRQPVAKGNSGVAGLQESEAGLTAGRNGQRGGTKADALLPDEIGGGVSAGGQPREHEEPKAGSEVCAQITVHGPTDPKTTPNEFQDMLPQLPLAISLRGLQTLGQLNVTT